eukprot:1033545-Rhodomonas_salina.1
MRSLLHRVPHRVSPVPALSEAESAVRSGGSRRLGSRQATTASHVAPLSSLRRPHHFLQPTASLGPPSGRQCSLC